MHQNRPTVLDPGLLTLFILFVALVMLRFLTGCGDNQALPDASNACIDADRATGDAPDAYVDWRDVFAAYARGTCTWSARCDPYDFYYTYLDVATCAREVTDETCLDIGGVIPCDDGYSGDPALLVTCEQDLAVEVCTVSSEAEPNSCAVALDVLRGD